MFIHFVYKCRGKLRSDCYVWRSDQLSSNVCFLKKFRARFKLPIATSPSVRVRRPATGKHRVGTGRATWPPTPSPVRSAFSVKAFVRTRFRRQTRPGTGRCRSRSPRAPDACAVRQIRAVPDEPRSRNTRVLRAHRNVTRSGTGPVAVCHRTVSHRRMASVQRPS